MRVRILPSKAKGIMTAPPSKSMAHRLIVCAGLAEGESILSNVEASEDILATLDCLAALGAGIKWDRSGTLRIKGCDIRRMDQKATLPCRECGSSLRFFIPLCLLGGEEKTLTGSETLLTRPLDVYEDICKNQGLYFKKEDQSLTVKGKLTSGDYQIKGDISSQFISGLLFALPLLDEDSRIRILPPVESRPYIDMTIQALTWFGIHVCWENEHTLFIKGRQNYLPRQAMVEGDYSNAAFFEALNLAGGDVILEGLSKDSLQGDKIYRKYFDQLRSGYADINIADCPDLGPVLIAVAALEHGARFTGTRRLRIKESDRGMAMKEEMKKLGIEIKVDENEIIVPETYHLIPESNIILDGHNDHRIVMALTILLSITGGCIEGAEAVNKSLPDYFERLRKLGIGVLYDELDK